MNEGRGRVRAAGRGPESGAAGVLDHGSPDLPHGAPMEEITLRGLLGLARRRWILILTVLLLTTLGVALVTFLILTPLYESTAVVLIKPGREFVRDPDLGDRNLVPNRMDGIVMAELEILHGEELLRDAVAALGPNRLYPDLEIDRVPYPLQVAAQRFREDFSAIAVPGADVIRLSFRHPDPVIAAESVNLLVDQFKEHHLKAFSEPQSASFLESRVTRYRNELEDSEEKLRKFQQEHPFVTVESPAQELEQQRAKADIALKQARNDVAALSQRVAFLKEHEASLSRTATLREDIDLQVVNAEAELRSQIARRKGLEDQLAVVEAELQALPSHLSTSRTLVRERDAAERRYRLSTERLEQALVYEEMDRAKIANITVIQRGLVPLTPSHPRKLLNLAIGSILGLGLGFGLALLIDGFGTQEVEAP